MPPLNDQFGSAANAGAHDRPWWVSFARDVLQLDRSVIWAIAARAWQFLAGGVSLWVVARFFSPELQGYYYAFINLLAIQTFFDLGLTGVLIYVASHEWSAARQADTNEAQLARRRLGELLRRSRRWYLLCTVGFCISAAGFGSWFFSGSESDVIRWRLPWMCAVICSGLSLWFSPSIVILEGCNFVAEVNAVRLFQGVLGNLVVWGLIAGGGELWAVVGSAAVRLLGDSSLVWGRFRRFCAEMMAAAADDNETALSWKDEVLPLQWRIALQSLAAYFLWQAYTPIIFKYHGPELGGRMGMTLNAISTIQMVALAWIQTRVPAIGRLLSLREFGASRALFRRVFVLCLAVYAVGGGALLLLAMALRQWWPTLAGRLLDPGQILLFEGAMGLNLLISGLGTYVRAHKTDPFLRIGLLNAIITGGLVWYFGARFGPLGAGTAHLAVTTAIMLPATWLIYQRTIRDNPGE
jgi:hypothetical protein